MRALWHSLAWFTTLVLGTVLGIVLYGYPSSYAIIAPTTIYITHAIAEDEILDDLCCWIKILVTLTVSLTMLIFDLPRFLEFHALTDPHLAYVTLSWMLRPLLISIFAIAIASTKMIPYIARSERVGPDHIIWTTVTVAGGCFISIETIVYHWWLGLLVSVSTILFILLFPFSPWWQRARTEQEVYRAREGTDESKSTRR